MHASVTFPPSAPAVLGVGVLAAVPADADAGAPARGES